MSDVTMSTATIAICDFEANIQAFNQPCFDLLLRATENTVVDSDSALKLISRLKLSKDIWHGLFSQLQ